MTNNCSSPIFIGGLMKSGTSLLRKLISNHPNIFGGLETHWFTEDFVNYWQDGQSERMQWLRQFYELSEQEMTFIINQSKDATEFFYRFMEYCTHKAGKKRWVEKTPDNVFQIQTILEVWPDAKVLIMYRNFLDVYASWKKNKKKTLKYFIETGKKYNEQILQYKDHPSILMITYKDLVTETQPTLQKVFHFIREDYLKGLEDYQGDQTDYEKVLKVTGKKSPTTESLSKPIFRNSIDQWKQVLDDKEVQLIQQHLS